MKYLDKFRDPQLARKLLANIRVYPEGSNTKDMEVAVFHASNGVEGASVQLEPQEGNWLDRSNGNFLAPMATRLTPLVATTDGSGVVTFPAAQLTMGANY